jgi:hypothetical protein
MAARGGRCRFDRTSERAHGRWCVLACVSTRSSECWASLRRDLAEHCGGRCHTRGTGYLSAAHLHLDADRQQPEVHRHGNDSRPHDTDHGNDHRRNDKLDIRASGTNNSHDWHGHVLRRQLDPSQDGRYILGDRDAGDVHGVLFAPNLHRLAVEEHAALRRRLSVITGSLSELNPRSISDSRLRPCVAPPRAPGACPKS